jgi:hypothetical protein
MCAKYIFRQFVLFVCDPPVVRGHTIVCGNSMLHPPARKGCATFPLKYFAEAEQGDFSERLLALLDDIGSPSRGTAEAVP